MKKFTLYIVSVISIILVCYFILFYSIQKRVRGDFNESKIILLGDSHTEYFRSPGLFNYSPPGSPYRIHEYLTNCLRPKKKTVIISVSPLNFSDQYQARLMSEEKNDVEWRKRFFIEQPEIIDLLEQFKFTSFSNLKELLKIGNASPYDIHRPPSISLEVDESIKKHFTPSIFEDTLQINSFQRLCENLLIDSNRVILVQTPMLTSYENKIPQNFVNRYNFCLAKEKNAHVLKVYSQGSFRDGDHLTPQSQIRLSEILSKLNVVTDTSLNLSNL